MIYLYSGTPGSGKSLQSAKEISRWIKDYSKNVISNNAINVNAIMGKKINRKHGRFFHVDDDNLTPDFLYKYALKYHDLGKESQTLLVIDEAQVKFSPTAIKLFNQENKYYRTDWVDFFTQHRHLGFDIILITQFDKFLDTQIRGLLEYNYVHRKANNFGTLGKIFSMFKIGLFIQVQKWYGVNEVCAKQFFTYTKKYSKIYDSYAYRSKVVAKLIKKYGQEEMERIMCFRTKNIVKK